MTTVNHLIETALPWPYCWEKMQWHIAFWLSQHNQRSQVQVDWSEATLKTQVSTVEFQEKTQDFLRELQQRLGERCLWQFDSREVTNFHKVTLGVSDHDHS